MSAYGNPSPYPSVDLERSALLGRLRVARSIIANAERPSTAARWQTIADELLDHLTEVDARAESQRMATALSRSPQGEETPDVRDR